LAVNSFALEVLPQCNAWALTVASRALSTTGDCIISREKAFFIRPMTQAVLFRVMGMFVSAYLSKFAGPRV